MKKNEKYACGIEYEVGDRVYAYGCAGTVEKITWDAVDNENPEPILRGMKFQQGCIAFDNPEELCYPLNHEALGTYTWLPADDEMRQAVRW